MERETGFEPATSTLARLHSTTELLPQSESCFLLEAASRFELEMEVLQTSALPLGYAAIIWWSGRRDLNPRLQPWQGCTLPLSYSRSTKMSSTDFALRCQQGFSEKRHFFSRSIFYNQIQHIRAILEQLQFETLRVSNHTACRFAEKNAPDHENNDARRLPYPCRAAGGRRCRPCPARPRSPSST